ncbi:ATP-dependent RNA helicase DDX50-like isoform X2 [Watersipora subatra]|uniref:ATP-dependent RNA helicase DDX50-like isoform X2 n=1 Tax=Watersipora subatra TaxID=2589382 RepID=UPI00355C6179
MKLTQAIPDASVVSVKAVKSKKVKSSAKSSSESDERAARLAEVLKKPRTRAVSLTLSENGINEEEPDQISAVAGEQKKKKKTKKLDKVKLEKTVEEVEESKVEEDGVPAEHSEGRFSNFPIREKTITKLKAKGIHYLFPVQVQTFKVVLEGKDVIAKARTGTGKTLAFALPLIEKLEREKPAVMRGRPPRVLVLAPTRELVNQVAKDFHSLSYLSIHAFYGGVSMHTQGTALRSGIDILVGTPGRLLDWIGRGQLDVSKLEHVVLDEVDQMLDMGFAEDVENIISHSYNRGALNPNPQTLLFSATLPPWVKATAAKYMETMPPVIDLVGNSLNQTSTNVTHLAVRSHPADHAEHISRLIQFYSGDTGRAMVFCPTKKDVDSLSRCPEIKQNKDKLHGDVKQSSRESVLELFRQGQLKVLVTTNVAARGIDIPEVDLVIQTYPPPRSDIESYIHRSGRTGRAGKSGISVCLYSFKNEWDLIEVEKFAKISFKRVNVPSSDQLANRGIKELTSSVEGLDEEVVAKFRESARELIEEKGAVDTVAALIALATGQSRISHESLITSKSGHITLHYTTTATIQFKGYVYNAIKNRCGDIGSLVMNMNLSKDNKGAVFDVSEETFEKYKSKLLFKTNSDSLVVAKTLPELYPYQQCNFSNPNKSAATRFNNGGRFGGFNKRRSFQGSNGSSMNKRIKFD